MSNNGIRLVLLVFLLGFVFLGFYFIKEMKKIEAVYEKLAEEIVNNY